MKPNKNQLKHQLVLHSFLLAPKLRCKIKECLFTAGNSERAHRMIEPELFFSALQQALKDGVAQVRKWNHISLLIIQLSYIYWNMPFWDYLLIFCKDLFRFREHGRKSDCHFCGKICATKYNTEILARTCLNCFELVCKIRV